VSRLKTLFTGIFMENSRNKRLFLEKQRLLLRHKVEKKAFVEVADVNKPSSLKIENKKGDRKKRS